MLKDTYDYDKEMISQARARGEDCPSTVPWREVFRNALIGGITVGVGTAIEGIKFGAAAGLAAGNPIVGGIVGGIAGFSIGFVGGAILTGGATYIGYKALPKKGLQICDDKNQQTSIDFRCLDSYYSDKSPNIDISMINSGGRTYSGGIIHYFGG